MLTEREGSLKYFNRNDVSLAQGLQRGVCCPQLPPPVGTPIRPHPLITVAPWGRAWVGHGGNRDDKPFPAGLSPA